MSAPSEDPTAFVYQAHAAGLHLARVPLADRNRALVEIAKSIGKQRDRILEANTLDLESSREMSVPELLLEWLKLTPERLQNTQDCLQLLADMPDPLSTGADRDGFRRAPLGMVAFVYEALPQLGAIAAGMCLKVGNSIILKGGNEVSHSQAVFAEIACEAIHTCNLPESCLVVAPQGSATKDLLAQEKYLRLAIPYGRPSFVQQISKQATVSVLPASMGNCYLYLAPTAGLEFATQILKNSRSSDPDPVNAIEKVVLHRQWLNEGIDESLDGGLVEWIASLQKQGLTVRGCDRTAAYCAQHIDSLYNEVVQETQWGQAYLDDTIALKIADDLDEAIAWINQFSSGHADAILTDSLKESHLFIDRVNSSSIYVNSPQRFHRIRSNGSRSVVLGLSSLKTRGTPGAIDLNALTTIKRIIT